MVLTLVTRIWRELGQIVQLVKNSSVALLHKFLVTHIFVDKEIKKEEEKHMKITDNINLEEYLLLRKEAIIKEIKEFKKHTPRTSFNYPLPTPVRLWAKLQERKEYQNQIDILEPVTDITMLSARILEAEGKEGKWQSAGYLPYHMYSKIREYLSKGTLVEIAGNYIFKFEVGHKIISLEVPPGFIGREERTDISETEVVIENDKIHLYVPYR